MTVLNDQRRAHQLTSTAIRKGVLIRPTKCSQCGCGRSAGTIHAHHHRGYEAEHALDVVWLCRKCHMRTHGYKVSEGGTLILRIDDDLGAWLKDRAKAANRSLNKHVESS